MIRKCEVWIRTHDLWIPRSPRTGAGHSYSFGHPDWLTLLSIYRECWNLSAGGRAKTDIQHAAGQVMMDENPIVMQCRRLVATALFAMQACDVTTNAPFSGNPVIRRQLTNALNKDEPWLMLHNPMT